MSETPRFAVVGNPIEHSLSPSVHALFAAQTGIELSYEKLLAPIEDFAGIAQAFFERGGLGLNVTAPFKGDAADWAEELDESAALAHSVNTIARKGEQHDSLATKGHSTDGLGLLNDLRAQWGLNLDGLHLLIVGAGGAVRGIIPSLLEQRPARLVIANRTLNRAQDLVENYRDLSPCELSARSLDARLGSFDLVINGASGLFETKAPSLGSSLHGALCYDLSYSGHGETGFCQAARRSGAKDTRDGLGMLVSQAALSFEIWHGRLPEVAPVLDALK